MITATIQSGAEGLVIRTTDAGFIWSTAAVLQAFTTRVSLGHRYQDGVAVVIRSP